MEDPIELPMGITYKRMDKGTEIEVKGPKYNLSGKGRMSLVEFKTH